MLNFWQNRLLAATLAGAATLASAQDLPRSETMSEAPVKLWKGELVELSIGAKNATHIIWYDRENRLCQGPVCQISTEQREPGRYLIGAVAINKFGSSFVSFKIELRQASPGRELRRELIKPPMVDNNQPDEIAADSDLYVVNTQGAGISYRVPEENADNSKLQVVRRMRRSLDWDEKLKSMSGVLRFGEMKSDEHYLYPGSEAQLELDETERRLIHLNNGLLRSRQQPGPEAPNWSVLAGRWLELNPSASSDFELFYASNNPGAASLTVLRGNVQVRLRQLATGLEFASESNALAEASWTFEAGMRVLFRRPSTRSSADFRIGVEAIDLDGWRKAKSWVKKPNAADADREDIMAAYASELSRHGDDYSQSYFTPDSLPWEAETQTSLAPAPSAPPVAKEERDWHADGSLLALYDTNIFRLEDKTALEAAEGLTKNQGAAYFVEGAAGKRFWAKNLLSVYAEILANRQAWLDAALRPVDRVQQQLALGVGLGQTWQWNTHALLETLIVNNSRALDGVGFSSSVTARHLELRPTLALQIVNYMDPLPEENALIDPLSQEFINTNSDRSSRLQRLRLDTLLYAGERFDLGFSGFSEQRALTHSVLTNERQQSLLMQLAPSLRGFIQERWTLQLSYRQDKYSDFDRSDATTAVTLSSQWPLGSLLSLWQSLGSESRHSNQDGAAYKKSSFALGLKLSL